MEERGEKVEYDYEESEFAKRIRDTNKIFDEYYKKNEKSENKLYLLYLTEREYKIFEQKKDLMVEKFKSDGYYIERIDEEPKYNDYENILIILKKIKDHKGGKFIVKKKRNQL
jgi:hypothetical protein